MKNLTIILLLLTSYAQSQTWQTVPISFYSTLPLMYWDDGDNTMSRNQHFKINTFDNSIWGVSKSRVFRIGNNGNFQLWDENNTNLFQQGDYYTDMAFQSGKMFLLSRYTGLYQYDGNSWGLLSGNNEGRNLSTDADTLWITRTSLPFNYYYSSMMFSASYSGAIRMVSKNGLLICSGDTYSGTLKNISNSTLYIYNTTTDTYYLDSKNYNFKFSPFSDTLFTSGDRGFSIAVNGVFLDTLTKYNTVNMPDLAITEFEFDALGNIWAVFSPPANISLIYPEKIGYLDRSTNTWSQFYDGSNSPINFANHRVTIELDTNGNLWVANGQNLHVLGLGTTPSWLGKEEVKNSGTFVNIYPNPSSGKINLSSNVPIREIIVYDTMGKVVKKSISIEEIILPKGLFIVQVVSENGEIFREKVVVE